MLQLKIYNDKLECGTDEAGRGCLAGPVTAAAVILPDDFVNTLLNDSKQLSLLKRNNLKPFIEQEAIAFCVSHVMMEEIDKINILQASITGMHRSISSLKVKPDFIAVDGNKFRSFENIPHQCVVKGDAKYLHIAAASVLAKTLTFFNPQVGLFDFKIIPSKNECFTTNC